jgi:hypothetical protein
MRAGSLEPGWYHELAQQAEAADGHQRLYPGTKQGNTNLALE